MKYIFLAALLLLAACQKDAPPAPSSEQSNQLNEAEGMLNAMANNEEGPETNAPGPSISSNLTD